MNKAPLSSSMQSIAVSSPFKASAKKAKVICDSIRGQKVKTALNLLLFSNKSAAVDIRKTVSSAMANAEHNYAMDIDNLIVKEISIEKAFKLRRAVSRGRGRMGRITRRFSRVRLSLAESAS